MKKTSVKDIINQNRNELVKFILEEMEKGKLIWNSDFFSDKGRSQNPVTNTKYRGVNLLQLGIKAIQNGYSDPRWVTFNQAKKLGLEVKKGERSTIVEYWSIIDNTTEEIKKEGLESANKIFKVRYHNVFNINQLKGEIEELPTINFENKSVDNIIKNIDVKVFQDSQNTPCYIPTSDEIHMINPRAYKNEYAYYSTLLHELAHATGHESRLNRNLKNKFGDEEYSKEELKAELAATFVSSEIGLKQNKDSIKNHAAYIKSWIQILKNKPEEFFKAVSEATKISDYLIEKIS